MFDETTQTLRGLKPRNEGWRLHHGQTSVQVMVQGSEVHSWRRESRGVEKHKKEPWICQPYRLFLQNADFLLEAILLEYPIELTAANMVSLLSTISIIILEWCTDRASVNYLVMRWLAMLVSAFPPHIWLHHEPCRSQALAPTKKHASFSKLMAALLSLSRILRVGRSFDDSRRASERVMRDNFIVVQ